MNVTRPLFVIPVVIAVLALLGLALFQQSISYVIIAAVVVLVCWGYKIVSDRAQQRSYLDASEQELPSWDELGPVTVRSRSEVESQRLLEPEPLSEQYLHDDATVDHESPLAPETSTVATETLVAPPSEAPFKVFPVLKPQHFSEHIAQLSQRLAADALPIAKPLFGDIVLSYCIDTGLNTLPVSTVVAQEYNLDLLQLQTLAIDHALKALSGVQLYNHDGLHEMVCDTDWMATAVLMPELWDDIEASLGQPVVMAVPHRDSVLYAGQNDTKAVAALQRAVAKFQDDGHCLSKYCYTRAGNTWQQYSA